MINPSASGWIDKFFSTQKSPKETVSKNTDTFYHTVRSTGFIYGHIISFENTNPIETKGWFKEEISKVALLNTLYNIFCLTNNDISAENFIKHAVAFYHEMHPQGLNILKPYFQRSK